MDIPAIGLKSDHCSVTQLFEVGLNLHSLFLYYISTVSIQIKYRAMLWESKYNKSAEKMSSSVSVVVIKFAASAVGTVSQSEKRHENKQTKLTNLYRLFSIFWPAVV